jgi:hypothetical protein
MLRRNDRRGVRYRFNFTKEMELNLRAVSLLERGGTAMVEYRKHPRHRTLKGGKIIYNRRLTVIDCIIRNMSEGGACLEVATQFLPEEFELSIPIDCVKHHCRVAWRTPNRIGVAFEDAGTGRAA